MIGKISSKRNFGLVTGVSALRPCARQDEHWRIHPQQRRSRRNQSNVLVSVRMRVGLVYTSGLVILKRTRLDPGSINKIVDQDLQSEKNFRHGAGSSWFAAACSPRFSDAFAKAIHAVMIRMNPLINESLRTTRSVFPGEGRSMYFSIPDPKPDPKNRVHPT